MQKIENEALKIEENDRKSKISQTYEYQKD